MHRDATLSTASLASAVLLAILCALTLATGVTQQWFESFHPEGAYAARLVHDGAWLRVIVALDDAFIAAYVSASVLLGMRLGRMGPIPLLVIAGGVAGGVLDLEENHHLLAMLRMAEADVAIPVADLMHRATLSPLKWMLGHLAFVLAGIGLHGKDPLTRVFRFSLLAVQLPIGALAWTVTSPGWATALQWARYVSFLAGFATLAWLSRSRSEPGNAAVAPSAAGSGAPA